ncbi:6367_t:CDS:2 [Funneliformis geosporum]|nr:6367_t:CDS:2 [Funneliformis geosporum]
MKYAEKNDLRKNLSNIFNQKWIIKLFNLYSIINGLSQIHQQNLIHCDFHHGNILNTSSNNLSISDLGLCKPVNYFQSSTKKNEIYGVLPFVAPEVLRKQPYTLASDIYSFSMIMWELISGISPFNGEAHNEQLAIRICNGERPKIIENIPLCYISLMESCWNINPLKRPTALEIKFIIENCQMILECNVRYGQAMILSMNKSLNQKIKILSIPLAFSINYNHYEHWICEMFLLQQVTTQANKSRKSYLKQLHHKNDVVKDSHYQYKEIEDGCFHELIHRDIHSGNILFVETNAYSYQWQIGDFGLSRPANITSSSDEIYGVISYLAPEVFNGASFSKASDVYSMAMIMWELTTGCKPFANFEQDHELIYHIIDGNRPEITHDTPECYANLMKRCWDTDPLKRPSIKEVRKIVGGWYYRKINVELFNHAEIKRLELIKSKKLGPEFIDKHPKAIYTSKPLNYLISKSLSINPHYMKQGINYIRLKQLFERIGNRV